VACLMNKIFGGVAKLFDFSIFKKKSLQLLSRAEYDRNRLPISFRVLSSKRFNVNPGGIDTDIFSDPGRFR
jgi:hypothetical protein